MAEDADHCNLIHVDWEKSAMAPLYNTAAANSKEVGYELSKLVHFLVSNGANLSTVHIVGFSMGAHVAGFAAKHFKKNYGQMLPRVTGENFFYLHGSLLSYNGDLWVKKHTQLYTILFLEGF